MLNLCILGYVKQMDLLELDIQINRYLDKWNQINGTRYLVLFGKEKYDYIYNRIRCLIRVKSGIT